ncbi:MAG: hypothetical protein QG635_2125 [Bacteroidota bacterium]|nr:hypothetical protein [Bacteroidota bacterium]
MKVLYLKFRISELKKKNQISKEATRIKKE